eukprot:2326700-Alexandrium_andersonii.AAC.1
MLRSLCSRRHPGCVPLSLQTETSFSMFGGLYTKRKRPTSLVTSLMWLLDPPDLADWRLQRGLG